MSDAQYIRKDLQSMNDQERKEEVERLQEKIFPEFKVAALTGKMSPQEKNLTMREFKEGKIQHCQNHICNCINFFYF